LAKGASPIACKDCGQSAPALFGYADPCIYSLECWTHSGAVKRSAGGAAAVALPITVRAVSPLETSRLYQREVVRNAESRRAARAIRLDTFIDASLYSIATAIRTLTAPFDSKKIAYWFPTTNTSAASQHAILHLIYSRFWTKLRPTSASSR